jgi:hypothetical protein
MDPKRVVEHRLSMSPVMFRSDFVDVNPGSLPIATSLRPTGACKSKLMRLALAREVRVVAVRAGRAVGDEPAEAAEATDEPTPRVLRADQRAIGGRGRRERTVWDRAFRRAPKWLPQL